MSPEYMWGQGFGFMWIFPLLFLGIFLYFMRGMFGQNNTGQNTSGSRNAAQQDTAREILDKRFASGEINTEEYEEMKKALGNGN